MADNENNTGSIQTVHGLSVEQSLLGAVNAAAGQEPDEEYETIPVDELDTLAIPTAVKAAVKAVRAYHP